MVVTVDYFKQKTIHSRVLLLKLSPIICVLAHHNLFLIVFINFLSLNSNDLTFSLVGYSYIMLNNLFTTGYSELLGQA